MTETVDALIDGAVKPGCRSLFHKVPAEVQPILHRAWERRQSGENIGGAALSRAIAREFSVHLTPMSLTNYLNGAGCRCEPAH